MARFSNTAPSTDLSRSVKGGKQVAPEEVAQMWTEIVRISGEMKEQRNWVTGGFVVLVFAVVAMIFSVGAVFNDYLANKQATYQALRDDVHNQEVRTVETNRTVDDIRHYLETCNAKNKTGC